MARNPVDNVLNFLVGKLGINMQGAEILTVTGRKSGVPRSIVVNPLEVDGRWYLLSAHGESNWVKNARAVGEITLHRGKRSARYAVREVLEDDEKLIVMRQYLKRWGWQVKSFMHVSGSSSDDELRAVLDKHPIFVLSRI